MAKYKSYRKEVEERLKQASETSLEAVGLEAQRDVTLKITDNKQVDTGRMRASVTYIAGEKQGKVKPDLMGIVHAMDNPTGTLPKNTLHVGSNVHYSIWQEKKKPFITPIFQNNIKQYTDMMMDIYVRLVGK